MDTAAEVLLIIVSAVLVIFLLAMIAVAYYFISVMRDVKRISQKAENAVTAVGSAASTFKRAISPMTLVKLMSSMVKKAKPSKDKKE